MEWPSLPLESWRPAQPAILVLALLAGFILLLWSSSHSKGSHAGEGTKKKLPPGPFIWPVVGCLPAVGFKYRHRTFYKLSKKYGPVMQNVLIAGIDTTARAIEWAMAELVANPEAIIKAQEELDQVVGKERLVNEMDIEGLPYLQAISKEVLRLHPSAPLDDPHLNEKPSSLGGYYIPANSIILHNLWALGQDESIWDNPTVFNPDRFFRNDEYRSMNVYGGDFRLLPFSSGRRRCPAYQFATLTLQHVVGVLLHAFDWSLSPKGTLNMEESDGIVVGLKHPLLLSVNVRLSAMNAT